MIAEKLLVAAIVLGAACFVLSAVRRSWRGSSRCSCGLSRCPAAKKDKTNS